MGTVKKTILSLIETDIEYLKGDIGCCVATASEDTDLCGVESDIRTLQEYIEFRNDLMNNRPVNKRILLMMVEKAMEMED